jgi:hypothetical protein
VTAAKVLSRLASELRLESPGSMERGRAPRRAPWSALGWGLLGGSLFGMIWYRGWRRTLVGGVLGAVVCESLLYVSSLGLIAGVYSSRAVIRANAPRFEEIVDRVSQAEKLAPAHVRAGLRVTAGPAITVSFLDFASDGMRARRVVWDVIDSLKRNGRVEVIDTPSYSGPDFELWRTQAGLAGLILGMGLMWIWRLRDLCRQGA